MSIAEQLRERADKMATKGNAAALRLAADEIERARQSEREGWRYATELEQERRRLTDRVERLRGALKTASGRFFEAGDNASADNCLEWAGDMETSIMRTNAIAQGPADGPAG